MTRDRIILLLLGVFALASVILGYSGLYDRLAVDHRHDLKREFYHIVDQAQLWYIRPLEYGGGGRSFVGLDFQKIGLANHPGMMTWNGECAHYTITDPRFDSFRLLADTPDGAVFETMNIRFDTRPELKRRL